MGGERYSFDDHIFAPGIQHLLRHARPRPGEHLLDLAAGSGIAARLCGEAVGPDGRITALDIGANILKKARSLYAAPAPAAWVRGDAVYLPFADRSFDVVVCHQGLQFFRDQAAAVGHLRRVLRPDGRAAIMTWSTMADCPFYQALHDAVQRYLGDAAAGFVSRPFSLPDHVQLRELCAPFFGKVKITGIEVDTVHPSPASFVSGFLNYLPPNLASPEAVAAAAPAIVTQVTDELAPWCVGRELRAPIPAHVMLCS